MYRKQKTFFLTVLIFCSLTFFTSAFGETVLTTKLLDSSIYSLFSQVKVTNDMSFLENKDISWGREFVQNISKGEEFSSKSRFFKNHSKSLQIRPFTCIEDTSYTIDLQDHIHTKNTFNVKPLLEKQPKSYGFYTGVSAGKIFSDNSQVFVGGIKAIGRRVESLIKESSYAGLIKTILIGEIDSIEHFRGEVNFQWLSNAFVGYYARENGRTEFEIIYSKINITEDTDKVFDESASIFTFLLNAYYNPSIQNTQFAPYVSLGIGSTVLRVKKFDKRNLVPLNVPWFAYQAKLGMDYLINSDITISGGYRYLSIPIPIADDIATHNIEIGLRFNL